LGETGHALDILEKILPLAESEGYFMTFVDEGEPVARLLYAGIQRNISTAYANRIIKAIMSGKSSSADKKPEAGELVEPLSERELEVLCLVAGGLSNAEIAGHLFISLSTVKGHTSNIFGKLGVKNRTQAVVQARSLGLLPPP
jgi:LuxR family transcriptional regulator, maltose regulon positive regulatory protein